MLKAPQRPETRPRDDPYAKADAEVSELLERVEPPRHEDALSPLRSKIASLHHSFSRASFDRDEVEDYRVRLREYYERLHADAELRGRALDLRLVLSNVGHAPATGVQLELEIPEGVVMFDGKESREAVKPQLPAHFRNPWEPNPELQSLAITATLAPRGPAPWSWYFDRAKRLLSIDVDKVIHSGSRNLPKVRIAISTAASSNRGFAVEATILVSSPPDRLSATLHVVT